jgi:hypothetical protein
MFLRLEIFKMNIKDTAEQLKGLSVFRSVLEDGAVNAFIKMCEAPSLENCGEFCAVLYEKTDNFSRYLLEKLLISENLYSVKCAADENLTPLFQARAEAELEILENASLVTSEDVEKEIEASFSISPWLTEKIDFKAEFFERAKNIKRTGFGVFAEHNMFTLEGREILPAIFKDDTSVNDLKGYENQRSRIENNIRALVSGKIAANMLLYGDSGTGKSATVKALANKYAPEGVRLIEIKKNQIDDIPYIMGKVSKNPLKFILFLDDLTFDPSDDSFGSMKAVLEGSVAARAKNTCVCVTSNRRHLVKESVSDRMAGDLHAKDTMEEIGALTQRFGLSVIYEKPDKATYLNVVRELAKDNLIPEVTPEMEKEAEAFAISKGGRSCRVAKQYIEEVLRRD